MTKSSSRAGISGFRLLNWVLEKRLALSLTVSLMSIPCAAAWASIELSDDVAGKQAAQGRDGIGYVTLRALGALAAYNLGVGQALLIEWSFF